MALSGLLLAIGSIILGKGKGLFLFAAGSLVLLLAGGTHLLQSYPAPITLLFLGLTGVAIWIAKWKGIKFWGIGVVLLSLGYIVSGLL